MDSVGIVILSRFSSSRLPGKALMEINHKPVLEYIIERLLLVADRESIVIATSEDPSDDPIVQFAHRSGIKCYRGSLENVSQRFYNAAKAQEWAFAARINGDNIFVDTEVLEHMLTVAKTGKYDFISNVKNRTFPKGMSIEIVRMSHYSMLLPEINTAANYREHVTSYLYEHDESANYHYVMNTDIPEAAGIQLALDTPEDMERSKKIISYFTGPHYNYNIRDIWTILKKLDI